MLLSWVIRCPLDFSATPTIAVLTFCFTVSVCLHSFNFVLCTKNLLKSASFFYFRCNCRREPNMLPDFLVKQCSILSRTLQTKLIQSAVPVCPTGVDRGCALTFTTDFHFWAGFKANEKALSDPQTRKLLRDLELSSQNNIPRIQAYFTLRATNTFYVES